MNKRILAVVLVLVITLSLALSGCGGEAKNLSDGIASDKTVEINDISLRSEDYSDFAARLLFDCFEAEGKGNTLVSPLSVALALAMTAEGANGETLEEIESVLGMDIEELREFAYSYMNAESDPQLSIANSLWVNNTEGFRVNKDFLEINADYHKADIFEATFSSKTVEEINAWVSDKTDGMLDSIIDTLGEQSVMCLVNALLFDAKWHEPYSEHQVDEGYFVTEEKVSQPAEFLFNMEGTYLEDEKATGFLKYYEGFDYAFVAMLPNEGISVEEYVMSLNGEKIEQLLKNKENCSVSTRLPKFESDFSSSLNDVLINMGMEKAFDVEKADFSKLGEIPNGNIYIGNVAHKTKISVTEQGTKAGAATAVIMYGAGAPQDPKEVVLDRPFVYMIMDMEKDIPIFIGTLMSVE